MLPYNIAADPRMVLVLLVLLLVVPVAQATVDNPADRLLRYEIDPYRSDRATGCAKEAQPGALGLQGWFESRFIGESWGIFNCRKVAGSTSWSLHAEGRAVDWKLDSDLKAERRQGDQIVSLLLRRDRLGNRAALARRIGVQEIIWRCRIWTSLAGGPRFYSPCRNPKVDKTTAHRDHVHVGLSWAGARMRTTFWRYYLPDPPPTVDPVAPSEDPATPTG
jgi:hypothetical protein